MSVKFSREFAMPNRWTFQIAPVREFVERWIGGRAKIVDPFSGESVYGTVRNDLGRGGIDAVEFLRGLVDKGESFDAGLLDPPYSPRQMAEVYRSVGKAGADISQNARLYAECVGLMRNLIVPGGVILRFGWNSCGVGDEWRLAELLTVCHGGAHNDTICTAWVRDDKQLMLGGGA